MTEIDWPQRLYEAADGNLEGLLEMWHQDMSVANGEMSNSPVKSVDMLRQEADEVSRERTDAEVGQVDDLPDDFSALEPPSEPEPVPEPAPTLDAAEVRRMAARHVREREEEALPTVDVVEEPEPAPEPALEPTKSVERLREEADAEIRDVANERLREQQEKVVGDFMPPSEEDLKALEPEPEPQPEPTPEPSLETKELRELASSVAREREQARIGEIQRPSEDDLKALEPEPTPESPKPVLDADELRKLATQVARDRETASLPVLNTKSAIEHAKDSLMAAEMFEPDEIAGIQNGLLKAVWSAAYINDLPDSAFLYVAPGGQKAMGKTAPRSLRYFPYKNENDQVDLPHLRNALSRIPQANLPDDVKQRLAARAQRLLDNNKSVDVTDEQLTPGSVDPLRKQASNVALEYASDGLNLRKPPATVKPPEPDLLSLKDLRRRMRDETLRHLSGETNL